jgi:ribose/xylose/arabinose/galactoside ABC-type transport system permease subunit
MTFSAKTVLVLAGIASLALVFLHVQIMYLGAPAYRYFGAGREMAAMAEAGSWLPPFLTAGIALLLAGFAAYAFSGAGMTRPLPHLRPILWTIGGIYTLRGLAVFIQLGSWALGDPGPAREFVFSLASLVLGLLYLAGVRGTSAERSAAVR